MYIPVMSFCCRRSVCCFLLLLQLQCCCLLLLLFGIVCRMTQFVVVVYCIRYYCFRSLHSIHDFVFYDAPLGSTVACSASIYLLSYNTHHASPKITGMRGTKAGGSPPRRTPPYTWYVRFDGVPRNVCHSFAVTYTSLLTISSSTSSTAAAPGGTSFL